MAPVGSYASSLSASAERCTVSRQRPVYVHFEIQRRQYSTVLLKSFNASGSDIVRPQPAPHGISLSTNTAVCPSCSVNSAQTPDPSRFRETDEANPRLSPGAWNEAPSLKISVS